MGSHAFDQTMSQPREYRCCLPNGKPFCGAMSRIVRVFQFFSFLMQKFTTCRHFSKKRLASLIIIVSVVAGPANGFDSLPGMAAQVSGDGSPDGVAVKAPAQARAKAQGKTPAEAPEKAQPEENEQAVAPPPSPLPRKMTTLRVITEDYEGMRLSYPSKISFDPVKKEIYVTDSGNGRILVYTHDFYPLLAVGQSHGIEAPGGLAVDVDGSLYVALAPGRTNPVPRIAVFSPSLRWEKDIVFAGFKGAEDFRPRNIAIHSRTGRLYVAGGFTGAVVLNKDGAFSHLLSPMDSLKHRSSEKATICDVEIGPAGKIFLLSEDMGRVYVYDQDENFLMKFGEKGGSSGKLSRPRGLGIDPNTGMVYVIDYMRHSANAYSADGRFLYEFGGKGWGRGWFQFPSDITVDAQGNVLVADTFNNRVQVLTME